MARSKSRPARWADAVRQGLAALNELQAAADKLDTAMTELRDVQSEYQGWRDNLPESLQGTELGSKLDQVADMDLEWSAEDGPEDAETKLGEAEGAELPLGFGRD